MPRVTFSPAGQVCQVGEGATILQASKAHRVDLSSCCGGQAVCTTCRVMVEEGIDNLSGIGEYEYDMLELLQLGPSYRLGCQAQVYGDVVVRVPQ